MIRRPPISTHCISTAATKEKKRQKKWHSMVGVADGVAHGHLDIALCTLGRGCGGGTHRFGHRAGKLARLRAGRLPVPARVGIIAALLFLPDLHHAEHAAHLDRTEWP